MYKVLIASLDNWNTLSEIPYVLKKGGCTVDLLCEKNAWLKANCYYDNWIESKESNDEYRQHLIEIVNNGSYNWVLLGEEPLIKMMNESITDEELFKKILPIVKPENRNILSSKSGLGEVCEKYSILSPGYLSVQGNSLPDVEFICKKINLPIIIKTDFSWGGLGIKVCNNKNELKNILVNIQPNEKVIMQEYIIGKEIPVEALFSNGELITYNVSEILTYDKDEFSYSTRRKYFTNTEIEIQLKILGESIGINGFANLAYIYSKEKNLYYLIEVDIRPNSWIAYGRFTGNDFSIGIKKMIKLDGHENETIFASGKINENKVFEVALFHKDLRRCLYKKDFKGLFKWVFNYHYWKFIPLHDRRLMGRIMYELWDEFFIEKMKRIFKLENNLLARKQ